MMDWSLETLQDGVLQALLAYWERIRGDRRMPSRQDISPADIPALLPFLILVDRIDDPPDFRFRLAGTNFRDITRQEATGKRIAEVFPVEFADTMREHWTAVADRQQPLACSGRLWVPDRDHVHWEGLLLPLSTDGRWADMLLGGIVFSLNRPDS